MGWDVRFQDVCLTRVRPDGTAVVILDDVSFAIPGGARVVVVGPSGAGKTSLLRLINRLDDVDSGTIRLDGADIQSMDAPQLRRAVGIVFQQPRLFDATVLENLNRPLELAGRPAMGAAEGVAALRRMDLPGSILESHARELSVGQQQRVAIARALVLEPEVLLLDEPTSALDERSAAIILQLLVDLNGSDELTMIMVTHTADHARSFGGMALALRNGEVQLEADIDAALTWALEADASESSHDA